MDKSGFNGLSVAAFESRMGVEMTRLIERHGGKPLVAPSMREVPLEENPQALTFGEQLIASQFDMLILLTGVGTRSLIEVLQTQFTLQSIKQALTQIILVARGPKPVAALKELGLVPQISVPEPNTWRDILNALDTFKPEGVNGLRTAVQEYGVSNPDLLQSLQRRGAVVTQVPVYRWALPQDTGPLRKVLDAILANQVDVMLITNAVQVEHIVKLLAQNHQLDQFRKALGNMMVASIGQIASERLSRYGFPVDLEPSHSKMGILVKEASECVHERLRQKRLSA